MKKKLLFCMVILMVLVYFQGVLVCAQSTETIQTVKVGFFAFSKPIGSSYTIITVTQR